MWGNATPTMAEGDLVDNRAADGADHGEDDYQPGIFHFLVPSPAVREVVNSEWEPTEPRDFSQCAQYQLARVRGHADGQ